MREAVPLRLIAKIDIRRIAGRFIVLLLLAVVVLTGLPDCTPLEPQAASARTVRRRTHSRVVIRKVHRRPLHSRSRRPLRPRRSVVRSTAAPGRTVSKKAPASKQAVKPVPATKAGEQQPATKAAVTKQPLTEPRPVQLDKTAIMARIYALRDQGLNEHLAGNHGAAVRRLLEATQLSSTYHGRPSATESLLFLDLATCAEQAGMNSVARQAYAQWLDRSPRSSEARIRLSGLLARQGQVNEATRVARRAIEMDPASPRAHLLLALLLEHQGELEQARLERDSSRALLESRPLRKPEPELKVTEVETGDFTPSGPENFDEIPVGLP